MIEPAQRSPSHPARGRPVSAEAIRVRRPLRRPSPGLPTVWPSWSMPPQVVDMPSIPSEPGRSRRPASAEAGFTLVEVLAALVITLLLVVALTPFVGQMLATWARGTETTRAVELVTRGVGLLRHDLRHAIVWTGYGKTEDLLLFRGNEVSMSFPAATGLAPGRDGLEMISITVDASRDG